MEVLNSYLFCYQTVLSNVITYYTVYQYFTDLNIWLQVTEHHDNISHTYINIFLCQSLIEIL